MEELKLKCFTGSGDNQRPWDDLPEREKKLLSEHMVSQMMTKAGYQKTAGKRGGAGKP